MKPILILLLAFTVIARAEKDEEFADRVAKAWNAKKTEGILALYGDPAALDPDTKAKLTEELIEPSVQGGYKKVSVEILPADPLEQRSIILDRKISYRTTEILGRLAINFMSGDKTPKSLGRAIVPFTEDAEGKKSFSVPVTKKIEWTGDEPLLYHVNLSTLNDNLIGQSAIAVVEKYGCIDWIKIDKRSTFLANKLITLIISPTPEAGSVDLEISKADEEPFLKKTITTSKGAVVAVE